MTGGWIDRKLVLLQACLDMLQKCERSRVVLSPMDTTVFYDDAECDGYCLMEDIKHELLAATLKEAR